MRVVNTCTSLFEEEKTSIFLQNMFYFFTVQIVATFLGLITFHIDIYFKLKEILSSILVFKCTNCEWPFKDIKLLNFNGFFLSKYIFLMLFIEKLDIHDGENTTNNIFLLFQNIGVCVWFFWFFFFINLSIPTALSFIYIIWFLFLVMGGFSKLF